MKLFFYFLLSLLLIPNVLLAQQTLSLAGEWEVAFDSDDAGSHRMLHRKYPNRMQLPGTTDEAQLGDSLVFQPSLTRQSLYQLARKHRYVGTAWYRRTVDIPVHWNGKLIEMMLERVLWQSRVFVDGKEVPAQEESLTTPHRYNLTKLLTPGKHVLLIRITNTRQYDISYQNLAHAYTDGTQTIWNGALGNLNLTAYDPVTITHLSTESDIPNQAVKVKVRFQNSTGKAVSGNFHVSALLLDKKVPASDQIVRIDTGSMVLEMTYSLKGHFQLWDEFSPNLYRLQAAFKTQNNLYESSSRTSFGIRTLTNANGQLAINGRRIFLRGTLESSIFPRLGHPPMDQAGWLKVFQTARAYGLNHLRFHSWCPPKAAFEVADSLGFYLQVELPMWSLQVGEDPKADAFITKEAFRINQEYGNHPSFCFFSMGNELEGRFDFLNQLVSNLKKSDNRHLYTTTTYSFQSPHGGWPEPADDYFITQQTRLGWVRGQGLFNQKAPSFNEDYSSSLTGLPVPLVTHEVGQYAIFPNVAEISKYRGVLKPLNLLAIRNDLEQKGLLPLADAFVKASGKLGALLYKEELERILKTKAASGIQLLDLHDFPGQGTAAIGLLDAFWDSKGIVSPEEFRQFCSPLVPLLRFEKATYTNQETFQATAELANFGARPLTNALMEWVISDQTNTSIARGQFKTSRIAVGNGIPVGTITARLSGLKKATQLTVTLSVKNTSIKNTWRIWVYPASIPEQAASVLITQSAQEALRALTEGRKVLFNPDFKQIKGVAGTFVPVFWSPVHFPEQAGTMGLLCDPKHPAFRNFPTDFHTDWQWWELCTRTTAFVLPDSALSPLVRQIDNFANNRNLASLFEAQVGKGQLIFCSFDISSNLVNRPAARQLRYSLLEYMKSDSFKPVSQIPETSLTSILK